MDLMANGRSFIVRSIGTEMKATGLPYLTGEARLSESGGDINISEYERTYRKAPFNTIIWKWGATQGLYQTNTAPISTMIQMYAHSNPPIRMVVAYAKGEGKSDVNRATAREVVTTLRLPPLAEERKSEGKREGT
jgi:hypothetical protein